MILLIELLSLEMSVIRFFVSIHSADWLRTEVINGVWRFLSSLYQSSNFQPLTHTDKQIQNQTQSKPYDDEYLRLCMKLYQSCMCTCRFCWFVACHTFWEWREDLFMICDVLKNFLSLTHSLFHDEIQHSVNHVGIPIVLTVHFHGLKTAHFDSSTTTNLQSRTKHCKTIWQENFALKFPKRKKTRQFGVQMFSI